jgi:hypothetical protein
MRSRRALIGRSSGPLSALITFDDGLVPDLPRGRGRSIGGDLDVGEEGSE